MNPLAPPDSIRHSSSLQPNAIKTIPARHIGKNHLVARLQPLKNLDFVDGGLAHFHLAADGFPATIDQFEEADGRVSLTEGGSAFINHIAEMSDLNRAIRAYAGSGALGQFARKRHVHRYGSIHHGRIDAGYAAWNN